MVALKLNTCRWEISRAEGSTEQDRSEQKTTRRQAAVLQRHLDRVADVKVLATEGTLPGDNRGVLGNKDSCWLCWVRLENGVDKGAADRLGKGPRDGGP